MSVVSDPGRDGRLTWSKYAEHEARKELSAIAIRKCDAHLAAFSRCAREQNLLVVFNCRAENRRMNDCLHRYTNETAFEEYKEMVIANNIDGETLTILTSEDLEDAGMNKSLHRKQILAKVGYWVKHL